jgi:hypothetical protein
MVEAPRAPAVFFIFLVLALVELSEKKIHEKTKEKGKQERNLV